MGRFQILEKLGAGGMGEVYRARQVALGREVALKTLIAADFADDPQIQRFQREVKRLSSLTHPPVVRVFESGILDGKPHFTMELIEGRDLQAALEAEGPPPAVRAIAMMAQLAAAGRRAPLRPCHGVDVTRPTRTDDRLRRGASRRPRPLHRVLDPRPGPGRLGRPRALPLRDT